MASSPRKRLGWSKDPAELREWGTLAGLGAGEGFSMANLTSTASERSVIGLKGWEAALWNQYV